MPAVKLTKTWFAPGGARFRPGLHEDMADDLMEHLPSSALVSDDGEFVSVKDWRGKVKATPVVKK